MGHVQHIGHLYQFDILKSRDQATTMQENLLQLCKNLLPNAVALTGTLAPYLAQTGGSKL